VRVQFCVGADLTAPTLRRRHFGADTSAPTHRRRHTGADTQVLVVVTVSYTKLGSSFMTSPEVKPAPTPRKYYTIEELCQRDAALQRRLNEIYKREHLSWDERKADMLKTLKECRDSIDTFTALDTVADLERVASPITVSASGVVVGVEEEHVLTEDETRQLDSIVNGVRLLVTRKLIIKRRILDTQASLANTRALEKRYQDLGNELESELQECENELITLVKPLRSSPALECDVPSLAPEPGLVEPSNKGATSPIKQSTKKKSKIRIGPDFQADITTAWWDFNAEIDDPITAVLGWSEDPSSTGSEERKKERLYTTAELEALVDPRNVSSALQEGEFPAKKSKSSSVCHDFTDRKRKRGCTTPGCTLQEFHLGPHTQENASGLRSWEKSSKEKQVTEMEPHPGIYKEQIVAKRVSLYWAWPENKWYSGIVHSYNSHNDTHLIYYDDGDSVYECLNDPTQSWKIGWPPKSKP